MLRSRIDDSKKPSRRSDLDGKLDDYRPRDASLDRSRPGYNSRSRRYEKRKLLLII